MSKKCLKCDFLRGMPTLLGGNCHESNCDCECHVNYERDLSHTHCFNDNGRPEHSNHLACCICEKLNNAVITKTKSHE